MLFREGPDKQSRSKAAVIARQTTYVAFSKNSMSLDFFANLFGSSQKDCRVWGETPRTIVIPKLLDAVLSNNYVDVSEYLAETLAQTLKQGIYN